MFYDFCPHCNQKLECDESMDNAEVTCPSCGKSFVVAKEVFNFQFHKNEKAEKKAEESQVNTVEKEAVPELEPLPKDNSTSVWTEEKEEKSFFENIKMGKSDLSNAFFSISVFHYILAFIIFTCSIHFAKEMNNGIIFGIGLVCSLILAGWGFLFMACSQFVRIIFYGALSCKKIKDMMEEDRKAKENPPAEP